MLKTQLPMSSTSTYTHKTSLIYQETLQKGRPPLVQKNREMFSAAREEENQMKEWSEKMTFEENN